MKTSKLGKCVLTSAIAMLAMPALASADLLVDFTPIPAGTNMAYSGPTPNARSLMFTSPLVDLRSALGTGIAAPYVDGYQVFANSTVAFSGLTTLTTVSSAGSVLVQPVTSGTFSFYSAPAYGSVLLLSGTFLQYDADSGDASVVTGIRNSSTGGFFSSTVSYTGGAIYTALLAAGGMASGDATLNTLLVSPPFSTETYLGSKYLAAFNARVQGQFSSPVVPEPTSASVLLAPVALVATRRRR